MFSYTFQWFVDKYEINCGAFVKSRINIRRWNICMAKLFWTAINNSLHVQTTHQSCKKSHTLVPLKRNKYISLSHNVFSIESTNNSIFNILLRCSMHASLITGKVKIRLFFNIGLSKDQFGLIINLTNTVSYICALI